MEFQELALKIVGNIFTVVFLVRALGAYIKKDWGDMISQIVFAVVLVGFIYFTDQAIGVLKFLWNITAGSWFGAEAA